MKECILEMRFSCEHYVAEFSCWEARDTNTLVALCMVGPGSGLSFSCIIGVWTKGSSSGHFRLKTLLLLL